MIATCHCLQKDGVQDHVEVSSDKWCLQQLLQLGVDDDCNDWYVRAEWKKMRDPSIVEGLIYGRL